MFRLRPRHIDVDVHCHGRMPRQAAAGESNQPPMTVSLPAGVRVVLLDGNAIAADGHCAAPEHAHPLFERWMRTRHADADTAASHFAALMGGTGIHPPDQWCVWEGAAPNVVLQCGGRGRQGVVPFGAYTHPFGVRVRYAARAAGGVATSRTYASLDAAALLLHWQPPPLDDAAEERLYQALGRIDPAAAEGADVLDITPRAPRCFQPIAAEVCDLRGLLHALLPDIMRPDDEDTPPRHTTTVNVYMFVCVGGGDAPPPPLRSQRARSLARWLLPVVVDSDTKGGKRPRRSTGW